MKAKQNKLYTILRVLAAAAWFGIILYAAAHRRDYTLEGILSYTPENQLLSALVLMGLFALKSLTVVFYSGILYAASGVLFPLSAAIAVNVCGTAVMALIPYLLSRSVGAARADELRDKYPRLRELERIRRRSPFAFVVVLRCVNIVNFDLGSMYCGAVRQPLASFLAGSVTGKLADIILISVMGASLDRRDPVPVLLALAIDLCIALVVVLWSRKQSKKETAQ